MNRRRFLESAALTSALALLPQASAAAQPDTSNFPTEPRARLAVASYPFRKDFDPKRGKMDLTAFPQMVVDKFQVHGIEPLDEHFPSTSPDYLAKMQTALAKAGCHVVNIPVGRLPSFDDTDPDRRNQAIVKSKMWIDVAAQLNCPGIRAHIARAKGGSLDAAMVADTLKPVADYGEQKHVVVSLENDDPSSEDAFFLLDVLQRAHHPWLRALPDFCNSMLLNKGEGYNDKALTALFPHACTISHVKEAESDNGKLYKIDLAKAFAIAKQAGYRGYYSMEFDQDGDPYPGTEHLIAESMRILSGS